MSISSRNRHFLLQQRLQQRRRESQDIGLSAVAPASLAGQNPPAYCVAPHQVEIKTDETYISGNR